MTDTNKLQGSAARRGFLPFAAPISSVSDIVALVGLLGGCLYFYSRAYNAAFLSSFGLGVGVVPMSIQDAMVDGLEGITLNILYLWVPVATAFLLYFLWIVGSRFFEPDQPTPSKAVEGTPDTWWGRRRAKVSADLGVNRLLTLLLTIIAAPAVLIAAVVIIAVPAEISAGNDVAALRAMVSGGCSRCAVYEVDTRRVVGRLIASTPERIFVLVRDGRIALIRLDDVRIVSPAPNDKRGRLA